MGNLHLMVAKAEGPDGPWRVIVAITPKVSVAAGDMVANAMTVREAKAMIGALRLGIAECQKAEVETRRAMLD